jgi:cyclic pyranopterin phosphate synthase
VGGRDQLRDGHGRDIGDLRISVTDRCNFRCQYCMPAEGLPWLERAEILTFEEITRLVRVFAGMGVGDVRLTGGEPLVRRDFPVLAGMIAAIEGVNDLSVTTNGFLLPRDAEKLVRAGINRFNVSVDSLQRDRFYELTRRDALDAVLRGLEILAGFPEAHPIKVNAVAMRGFTEEEVLPFARLARETPYEVRFIEFMPLDGDGIWRPDLVVPSQAIQERIEDQFPLVNRPNDRPAPSNNYGFADGAPGGVGFISSVSQAFCTTCNRIRLTAEGGLRTCLFSLHETPLRDLMRQGASDNSIARVIEAAIWKKEEGHHIGEAGFIKPAKSMSQIGG